MKKCTCGRALARTRMGNAKATCGRAECDRRRRAERQAAYRARKSGNAPPRDAGKAAKPAGPVEVDGQDVPLWEKPVNSPWGMKYANHSEMWDDAMPFTGQTEDRLGMLLLTDDPRYPGPNSWVRR